MLGILVILSILIGFAMGSAHEKGKQREISRKDEVVDFIEGINNFGREEEKKRIKVAESPDEKRYKIGWRSNRDYADSIWTDSFARFRKLSKGQKITCQNLRLLKNLIFSSYVHNTDDDVVKKKKNIDLILKTRLTEYTEAREKESKVIKGLEVTTLWIDLAMCESICTLWLIDPPGKVINLLNKLEID